MCPPHPWLQVPGREVKYRQTGSRTEHRLIGQAAASSSAPALLLAGLWALQENAPVLVRAKTRQDLEVPQPLGCPQGGSGFSFCLQVPFGPCEQPGLCEPGVPSPSGRGGAGGCPGCTQGRVGLQLSIPAPVWRDWPKERCQTARGLRGRQHSACTSALSLCLLREQKLLTTTQLRLWESQQGRRDTGWEGAFLPHNVWDQTLAVITATPRGQGQCLPPARRFLGELINSEPAEKQEKINSPSGWHLQLPLNSSD